MKKKRSLWLLCEKQTAGGKGQKERDPGRGHSYSHVNRDDGGLD